MNHYGRSQSIKTTACGRLASHCGRFAPQKRPLEDAICNQADQNEYVKRMSDSFIPALVDKKMISKSFADTGFSIAKNNKTLPGANTLRYIDEHHFLYEVLIDRTQMCQSFFRFYIFISGCNFQIRNTQDVIFADSREEAAKKLSRLAEFCVKLREEFGEYLSERFGDTPEWYEWNAGDC